jgi:hypothetical protein
MTNDELDLLAACCDPKWAATEIERLRAALEHIATRNFIGAQCRRFARETLGMPPDEPSAPPSPPI